MLMTADQHRRLAEIYEEAAADQSHTPEDRAFLLEKAARFGGSHSSRTEVEGSPLN